MKVAELIKALQGVNPKVEVVVPGLDHTYRRASVHLASAMPRSGDFDEHYGEGGVTVVVIE